MYILIIKDDAEIEVNGFQYRFRGGGQNQDRSGEFTFTTQDGTAPSHFVIIKTPADTVLHRSDSIKDVIRLLASAL